MENRFEIDLKQLIAFLIYKAWIILIVVVVCAVGGYIASSKITPLYTSSAKLYVTNYLDEAKVEPITRISNVDVSTAQSLVQTYLTFLRTNQLMDVVSEKLDGKYKASQLKRMLSARQLDDTEVFSISITCPDPSESTRIVNLVAGMANDVISNFVEGSSAKVVDYAAGEGTKTYPQKSRYVFFAGAIGGGICTAILVLLFLLDTRIKDEEELTKMFNYPVIGNIPNYNQQYITSRYQYKKYKKYGYKYGYNSYAYKQNDEKEVLDSEKHQSSKPSYGN